MTMVTTASAPPTCSARVGFWADEWREQPVFCSTSVGLTRYTDKYGIERAFCRHHKGLVQFRYPPAPAKDECRMCHRPLVGDDWRLFDDKGSLFVVCGSCQDKADLDE